MSPIKTILAIAATAWLASGCSSTLKATRLDADGRFSTQTAVSEGAVKVQKPFTDKYRSLVYLKFPDGLSDKYTDFFATSFANMGVFQKVARKSDMEQLVIERKLTDKVSNVSDLIGLNNLQKQIGPFLVVEPDMEWKGGYNYHGAIKAIDPETGETVLLVEQDAFNWSGLDAPLFYPLLNAVVDWTHGRPIMTQKPVATVGSGNRRKTQPVATAAPAPMPAPAPAATPTPTPAPAAAPASTPAAAASDPAATPSAAPEAAPPASEAAPSN